MNPDPIDDDEPSIVVRPRRKGIYALPNAITLGALFSAFYAIVMAMNGRFEVACVAIFAAHPRQPGWPRRADDQHPVRLR